MLANVKAWLLGNLALILAVALAAAVVFGVVQTVRINGVHVGFIHIAGLKDKSASVAAVREVAKVSEQRRDIEQAQDRASYGAQDQRCDARVETATKAAATIKDIVNAPATQSPAVPRALVPAAQLRVIVGQGAAAEAAAVPAGGNGQVSR